MDRGIVPVGGTIGILGGGQLGRMMAIAGRAMGLHTVVWDPVPGPAGEASDAGIWAPYTDTDAFERFVAQVDRVTYEFENVDVTVARRLAERKPVFPPPDLLHISQHRLREKEAARLAGLETTPYAALESPDDVARAVESIGLPAILKTVQGGYDGKGQWPAATREDAWAGYEALKQADQPLIYERRVDFEREVSVVVARDQEGRTVTYPVSENQHRHGILDRSIVPARVEPQVAERARQHAIAMADGLNLVGVMALEFFVTAEGTVLFNEMAPRPHNSGHWTIEAALPSQFAQHMRAVAGWAVAEPQLLSPVVMLNLLGDDVPGGPERLHELVTVPGAQVHWYGKTAMRPGRKVGHVTVVAPTVEEALARAEAVRSQLGSGCASGT